MSFTQLHLHTIYSQLDGVSSSEEYAKLAAEKGHPSLAITDHGVMNGFLFHQQACLKYNIKPIFGVEAYVDFKLERTEMKSNKLKRIRNKNMHLILLAKNEIGYKNLLKLNYISNSDDKHFYYRNLLTIKEVLDHKEGLIIGSGCGNSPVNTLFREGKLEEAEKLYKLFCDEMGEDFYSELHISELLDDDYNQQKINEFQIKMANKYNKLIVLAGDVHYDLPGKDQIQTLSIAIRNKDTIDNLKFQIESKNLYYHDIDDYKQFNKQWNYNYSNQEIETWCNNTLKIAEKCNYLIPERNRMILPKISPDDDELLIEKSKIGLMKKLNCKSFNDIPEEYKKRLNAELSVLVRKGMSSYLMILEDIFDFVDKEEIMRGCSRGSGGGSLVLYALNISTIDPIKYGLIFERFLSQERSPDVMYDWFGKLKNY